MSPEDYRRHAAECLRIAEGITEAQDRAGLICMAQVWLQLARQAEKNLTATVVYETPSKPRCRPECGWNSVWRDLR